MPRQLQGAIALVTGGSRGIGRATCIALADAGATVYTCARSVDDLAATAAHSERIHAIACDVTQPAQVRDMLDRIARAAGRLDVLVNNAGVLGPKAELADITVAAWRQTMAVNVDGVFFVSKFATPLLRKGDQPFVLNVSSSVGREGRAKWGPYSASKHALEGISGTLAAELADDGGLVVSVNPGGTATDMRADAYPAEDPSTIPQPADIAAVFVRMMTELDADSNGAKLDARDFLTD